MLVATWAAATTDCLGQGEGLVAARDRGPGQTCLADWKVHLIVLPH